VARDSGMKSLRVASELLKPYDARLMRCYPISTRINHVANDDEECGKAMELAEIQKILFSHSRADGDTRRTTDERSSYRIL